MSIRSDIRLPFGYAKVEPGKSPAIPAELPFNTLLMAQMNDSITTGDLQPFRAFSAGDVEARAGAGSMAHRMAEKWFKNNNQTELNVILVKDPTTGAVKATGKIQFSGIATETRIYNIRLNGVTLQIPVNDTDTAVDVATTAISVINGESILPFVASLDATSDVLLTAKNAGLNANALTIEENYADDMITPAGITTTIVAMSGGAGVVDITEIFGVIGNEWYNLMISPWHDEANLDALDAELTDRFGETRMIDGVAFTSRRGTPAQLVTFGNGRNDIHTSVFHSQGIAESTEEYATGVCANVAWAGSDNPAKPFQSIVMKGFTTPKVPARFNWDDNNNLLFNGISTWTVDAVGNIRIARLISLYQVNSSGNKDDAWLNVNTLLQSMYVRWDTRFYIPTKYPRELMSYEDDITVVGEVVVTPALVENEMVNRYKTWTNRLGITQNIEAFKNAIHASVNPDDPDRIDVSMDVHYMNQFRVFAAMIYFFKAQPVTQA